MRAKKAVSRIAISLVAVVAIVVIIVGSSAYVISEMSTTAKTTAQSATQSLSSSSSTTMQSRTSYSVSSTTTTSESAYSYVLSNSRGSSTIDGCAGSSYLNYGNSYPAPGLVLTKGVTGMICVEYSFEFPSNGPVSFPSNLSIYEINTSRPYGVCPTCSWDDVTSEFNNVSASPAKVSLNDVNETEIVTYTFTAPSNITSGIYGISLLEICIPLSMVVIPGSSISNVSPDNFTIWTNDIWNCPAITLGTTVLGVSGFDVVYY